ncbi:hypothetical protein [Sideroxydans sp. CL21]|uniref:hypothetical protein n=1 Tax=Sideroxydans sp. CL21 TaxID=2600596 RepID=UPI0032DA6FF5
MKSSVAAASSCASLLGYRLDGAEASRASTLEQCLCFLAGKQLDHNAHSITLRVICQPVKWASKAKELDLIFRETILSLAPLILLKVWQRQPPHHLDSVN